MRFISAVVLVIIFSLSLAAKQPRVASGGQDNPAQKSAARVDNIRELRDDLQRMKTLVQQMETNLAFVDTTQSPLKHQFQLEIDMWKTVISEMERKLNAASTH